MSGNGSLIGLVISKDVRAKGKNEASWPAMLDWTDDRVKLFLGERPNIFVTCSLAHIHRQGWRATDDMRGLQESNRTSDP